jgi:hypothetical protein
MKRVFLYTVLLIASAIAYGQPVLNSLNSAAQVKVVVFLAVDCPISQKYIPTLNALKDKYTAQQVLVYTIIPGAVKKEVLRAFVTEYNIGFTVTADKRYRWVKALHPHATPEVFVYNSSNALQYRGAIDNWFYDLGRYRSAPTENYLADALDSILTGRQPATDSTVAIGCPVQYQ